MENRSIKSTWTDTGSANTWSPTALFCESCQAYLGATQAVCPRCGSPRSTPLPTRADQPLWRGELAGAAFGSPLVAGELLLFVSGDRRQGWLTALDRRSGARRWQFRAAQSLKSGLALAEGRVYFASRGLIPGAAQLYCCDLATGQRLWSQEICGGGSPPVLAGSRLYLGCEDGYLRCLDARTGEPLPGWSLEIPAGRVWQARAAERLALVCANGQVYWLPLDRACRKLPEAWELGGAATSPPVVADGWLYAGLEGGQLAALNLQNGARRLLAQGLGGVVAAPAVDGQTLFVGGMDHSLRALELPSGVERWQARFEHAIAAAPLACGGLVFCTAHDGALHAIEAASGDLAWNFPLDASHTPEFGSPQLADGVIYIGGANGQAYALPWRLGRYEWAAGWLEKAGCLDAAAECRALEGDFSQDIQTRQRAHRAAADNWRRAGQAENSAQLWLALDQHALAAEAFQTAGLHWRMQDSARAAGFFAQAAHLYFNLHQRQAVNECTRALASCACLPYVSLQPINLGKSIQWEQGELTLRVTNEGRAPMTGLRMWIGGALKSVVEARIPEVLLPGQMWRIPLTVIPTQAHSALEIEIEYPSAAPEYPLLRGMLAIDIQAIEPPKPPVQFGDVGMIRLTIGGETAEGLRIIARDVGVMRSESGIGEATIAGDVGAVSAHNGINQANIAGDVGVVSAHNGINQATIAGDVGLASGVTKPHGE